MNDTSASNFNIYTVGDGADLTSSFDFDNVMLYSSYSFSNNGLPTIVKNNGSTFTVQRSYLSTGDIEGIAILYPSLTTDFSGTVSILANNSKYLSSENGVRNITIDRSVANSWETFEFIDEGKGKYSKKRK